jgi:hypothetical protein
LSEHAVTVLINRSVKPGCESAFERLSETLLPSTALLTLGVAGLMTSFVAPQLTKLFKPWLFARRPLSKTRSRNSRRHDGWTRCVRRPLAAVRSHPEANIGQRRVPGISPSHGCHGDTRVPGLR